MLRKNALGILAVVLVIQAAFFYSASHGDAVSLPAPLVAFSSELGDFRTYQDGVVEPETLEILRADDTLIRWYKGPSGDVASLFIAYFKTQRNGQSPHSPKNCLPGSGWQPSESGRIMVKAGGDDIEINRYLVSRGENESLVMYWYQSQGRVIADEFAAKFWLISDSIRHHRSDTALVRVIVGVPPNGGAAGRERAEQTALSFVKSVYPPLKTFLPH